MGLHPQVSTLVDYVWSEASGELRDVLAVGVESIKVDQLDKAEAALLSIKRLLSDTAIEKSKRGVFACMCACVCVCVRMRVCMHVCVCVRACVCVLVCVHACMCVRACVRACIRVCACVCAGPIRCLPFT